MQLWCYSFPHIEILNFKSNRLCVALHQYVKTVSEIDVLVNCGSCQEYSVQETSRGWLKQGK